MPRLVRKRHQERVREEKNRCTDDGESGNEDANQIKHVGVDSVSRSNASGYRKETVTSSETRLKRRMPRQLYDYYSPERSNVGLKLRVSVARYTTIARSNFTSRHKIARSGGKMKLRRGYCAKSILTHLWLLLVALSGTSAHAAAEVVTTIQLKDALSWQFETDIGTMHFIGGGELWSVDLLRKGELIGKAIPLSGADDNRSVRHIPRTNILLVTQGQIGASNQSTVADKNADSSADATSSYAIDIFSGEILWEAASLPIPDELHYFAESKTAVLRTIPGGTTSGKRAGKSASNFTAIDLQTGAVLWTRDDIAQAVWKNGPFLEIAGTKIVSINAASGTESRVIDIPPNPKSYLMVFPDVERILRWKSKSFSLFEIPTLRADQLTDQELPTTMQAREVWNIETDKKLGEMTNQPGLVWGPKYASDELLLIKSKLTAEVVKFDSGDSIWTGKTTASELEISPNGTYAAYSKGKKFYVVNMQTGSELVEFKLPNVKWTEAAFPRVIWQGDYEFIVVLSDSKQRPRTISRFDLSNRSLLWSVTLPEAAKYRMTGGEKGKLFGRIFLSVALTAVSLNNPVASGGYQTYYVFVPNLHVKSLPDSDAGLEALEDSLQGAVDSGEARALRRYIERSRLISEILGKKGLFVTGKGDQYQIVSFDMDTGDRDVVATYAAPKVHGIEPDIVYGLAIAQEENRLKVNVIAL